MGDLCTACAVCLLKKCGQHILLVDGWKSARDLAETALQVTSLLPQTALCANRAWLRVGCTSELANQLHRTKMSERAGLSIRWQPTERVSGGVANAAHQS